MGLFASLAVILMGIVSARSSLNYILHPSVTEFNAIILIILLASIVIKIYIFFYNKQIGKKIDSVTMNAIAIDSLSDSVATTVVLLSTLVSNFTTLRPDGWCGLLVSFFIIFAGYQSLKETLDRIMGKAPNKELVKQIHNVINTYTEVLKIHNLTIHDYGLGRIVVSLHIAGDYDNQLSLHSAVDDISYDLYKTLNCECTIQMDLLVMDPINNNN